MSLWRDLQLVSGAGEPRVFDFKGGSAQSDVAAIDRIYGTGRAAADADSLVAELLANLVGGPAPVRRDDGDGAVS